MARISQIRYDAGVTLPTVSYGNSKVSVGANVELDAGDVPDREMKRAKEFVHRHLDEEISEIARELAVEGPQD